MSLFLPEEIGHYFRDFERSCAEFEERVKGGVAKFEKANMSLRERAIAAEEDLVAIREVFREPNKVRFTEDELENSLADCVSDLASRYDAVIAKGVIENAAGGAEIEDAALSAYDSHRLVCVQGVLGISGLGFSEEDIDKDPAKCVAALAEEVANARAKEEAAKLSDHERPLSPVSEETAEALLRAYSNLGYLVAEASRAAVAEALGLEREGEDGK